MSRQTLTAFVIRRVFRTLAVLISVSFLTFLALDLAPGDFTSESRLVPGVSTTRLSAERARLELDRPLVVRYGTWLRSVARGEGGRSFAYDVPVSDLVRARAPVTMLLVLTALVVSWASALIIGVWTAVRRHRWDGRVVTMVLGACMGVPDLVVALGLLLIAGRLGILPAADLMSSAAGESSAWARMMAKAPHLPLPVVALTIGLVPTLQRHVRSGLLGVLDAPFLLAARAKGVPERRLVWRWALRAAAGPLAALFGLSFATAFSASMVIEVIMSWPGLGPLFLEAVLARDLPIVVAGVTLTTSLLVVGSTVSDALLQWADPRVVEE